MGFMTWIRTQWDRAAALGAVLIGLLAFLLGWRGVSGEAYVAKQLPYIVSGALFGIFMAGIASALWLSADLRDEWRELRAVRHLLRDQNQRALHEAPAESVEPQSFAPAEPQAQSFAVPDVQPAVIAPAQVQPLQFSPSDAQYPTAQLPSLHAAEFSQ